MLNIDISDTVAGKQIFEEGMLEEARNMVLDVLEKQFKIVPSDIIDRVKSIDSREILKKSSPSANTKQRNRGFQNYTC